MSGALERLASVRKDMQDLRRDLDTPKRYFDAEEVNREVRQRLFESAGKSTNSHTSTEAKP